MDFSFCRLLFFPCFSPLFARGKLHQIWLPLRGEGSLSGFVLPTEISRLRRRLSVFLSRRKKNSEKERPLRGLRREVRFIMSPPGKRRHNELNAAPPPETPRGTGKPGAASDRDVVHSGESFRIRGKSRLCCVPRGTIPPRYHSLPLEGKQNMTQFSTGISGEKEGTTD